MDIEISSSSDDFCLKLGNVWGVLSCRSSELSLSKSCWCERESCYKPIVKNGLFKIVFPGISCIAWESYLWSKLTFCPRQKERKITICYDLCPKIHVMQGCGISNLLQVNWSSACVLYHMTKFVAGSCRVFSLGSLSWYLLALCLYQGGGSWKKSPCWSVFCVNVVSSWFLLWGSVSLVFHVWGVSVFLQCRSCLSLLSGLSKTVLLKLTSYWLFSNIDFCGYLK